MLRARRNCRIRPTVLRRLFIPVVLAALPLASASGAHPEFVIRIHEHRFEPAELHIPEGRKVRIVVENLDDTPEEFDSHSLNREKHIPAKSRVTLFIGPLEAGRYLYEGESADLGGPAALGVIVVP